MRAGIVSRTDIPTAVPVTKRIIDYLLSCEVDVCVETDTALAMNLTEGSLELSELDCDFMVTVGGDGTILRAAMEMKNPETPIFGVNMGRRGFLSEVLIPEAEWGLDKVLKGDYFVEESMKVSSRCLEMEDSVPDALNEVLVTPPFPSKMILMGLSVDGEPIIDIQADGAMVATPAGSTAYNMSAGGSIVAPRLEAMLLTAICPYSYFRSLVIPPESVVTIELLKPRSDAMVIVDGRTYVPLKPMSTIECRASPVRTRFIRFRSFYSRIQKRIMTLQTM
jgi:NAD+ kinase